VLAYTFATFVRAACRSVWSESDTSSGPFHMTWSAFAAWIAAHSVVATTPTKFSFWTVCTNPGIARAAASSSDWKVAFLGLLVNERVGPDPRHQLVLADHFAGALDEGNQDIESAASDANGLVALEQEPLSREQPEGAKRDR
jgi:hypothetical protein